MYLQYKWIFQVSAYATLVTATIFHEKNKMKQQLETEESVSVHLDILDHLLEQFVLEVDDHILDRLRATA